MQRLKGCFRCDWKQNLKKNQPFFSLGLIYLMQPKSYQFPEGLLEVFFVMAIQIHIQNKRYTIYCVRDDKEVYPFRSL